MVLMILLIMFARILLDVMLLKISSYTVRFG